jgi:death on curing protein
LPSEPRWLDPADVIEINRIAVEQSCEPFCLLSENLLLSGLHRAQHYFNYLGEDDTLYLAILVMQGIATNHPFQQGNKRTAFLAGVTFLELNGYILTISDTDSLALHIELLTERKITVQAFYDFIASHVASHPGT